MYTCNPIIQEAKAGVLLQSEAGGWGGLSGQTACHDSLWTIVLAHSAHIQGEGLPT